MTYLAKEKVIDKVYIQQPSEVVCCEFIYRLFGGICNKIKKCVRKFTLSSTNRGSIVINFMNFAQSVETRSTHVRSPNRKKTPWNGDSVNWTQLITLNKSEKVFADLILIKLSL